MEQKQIVLPLDLSGDEARLTWKGTFYAISCALYLPGRAEVEADVAELLDSSMLVVKLIPFRDKLRSRMLSLLADEGSPESQGNTLSPGAKHAWGAVVGLSIREGTLTRIDDVRRALPQAGLPPGQEFDPASAEQVTLAEEDKESLRLALQKYVGKVLLPYVREPFASFVPEMLGEAWKNRTLPSNKPDSLVPFQFVFPDTFPFDFSKDGEDYFMDDLYCTRPGCPCTDVSCLVLKHDEASGQNVAILGFKYATDTGKIRPMSEFPNKFNPAEWFKRFSKAHPIDLEVVLRSRYRFMRNQFIEAYWRK